MSGPVPSPSMKGMIGWLGTLSLPPEMVIFSPPAGGVSGKSFNIFNADTGHWEQFWVDNSGSRLHLSGGRDGEKMVLRGVQDKANAQTGLRQHERITWTPNADGSVRQHWETSNDDGRTWATSFDGLYRRAFAAPGE